MRKGIHEGRRPDCIIVYHGESRRAPKCSCGPALTNRGRSPNAPLTDVRGSEDSGSGGRESHGRTQHPGWLAFGHYRHGPGAIVAHRAAEIFIQGEKTVGLQFPENPPQFLLDFVKYVKECAAVDFEAPTA